MFKFRYSLLYSLALHLSILNLNAQVGFKQSFFSDTVFSVFSDLFISNDTIICNGKLTTGDSNYYHPIFTIKLDSLGSILHYELFIDSTKAFSNRDKNDIKFDSAYIYFVGDVLDTIGWNNYLAKVNSNCSFDTVYQYSIPSNILFRRLSGLHILSNKLLLIGYEQLENFNLSLVALWLNMDGSIIKLSEYGEPLIDNRYYSSYKENDTIFIGSHIGDTKAWILGIDSEGTLIWEWKSDQALEFEEIQGITKSGDKIIFCTTRRYNEDSIKIVKGIIGQLDIKSKNIDWYFEYGPFSDRRSRFYDLIEHGNGYLAVGVTYRKAPDTLGGNVYVGVWSVKIDKYGEKLWERIDTIWIPILEGSNTKVFGIDTLSSGSIVMCGEVLGADLNTHAFLLKIDKNGCLEIPCDLSSHIGNLYKPSIFTIAPNPVSNILNIYFPNFINGKLFIINTNGKIILQLDFSSNSKSIDVSGIPSGIYYISIKTGIHTVTRKFIKI